MRKISRRTFLCCAGAAMCVSAISGCTMFQGSNNEGDISSSQVDTNVAEDDVDSENSGSVDETVKLYSDYVYAINESRDAELSQYYHIAFLTDDNMLDAVGGYSADYESKDELNEMLYNFEFPMLSLDLSLVKDMAYSLSSMMTQSYCIAIVMPNEGCEEAVVEALEAFISAQKQAQENYLMDQYEIACNAKVEILSTGEVVLICCDGSDDVLESIKEKLSTGVDGTEIQGYIPEETTEIYDEDAYLGESQSPEGYDGDVYIDEDPTVAEDALDADLGMPSV